MIEHPILVVNHSGRDFHIDVNDVGEHVGLTETPGNTGDHVEYMIEWCDSVNDDGQRVWYALQKPFNAAIQGPTNYRYTSFEECWAAIAEHTAKMLAAHGYELPNTPYITPYMYQIITIRIMTGPTSVHRAVIEVYFSQPQGGG